MSTNAPWAPQQGAPSSSGPAEPEKVNGQTAAPIPSTEAQELVDENDPRLISETLDANLEADAYAQPAPPPDGKYRAKMKLEGVKLEGGDKKDYVSVAGKKGAAPYYRTGISCTIIDPSGKYDGIVCYPAFGGGANTNRRRDGSTQVTTILARVKGPDGNPVAKTGTRMDQKSWIELLVKTLATEPEIGIETSWEASCMKCSEELKPKGEYPARTTGMHHFPQEQDGNKRKAGQLFAPEVKCAANAAHGYARARAIVTRFLHLHELK